MSPRWPDKRVISTVNLLSIRNMLDSYSQPLIYEKAFTCTHCGVYARQDWGLLYRNKVNIANGRLIINQESKLHDFDASRCENCGGNTIWHQGKMIFPFNGISIHPNRDMPEDVKSLFLEGRNIAFASPRGAGAILRLAIRKLFRHLDTQRSATPGNDDFTVSRNLPPRLVQALRTLKISDQEDDHSDYVAEDDNPESIFKILAFINIICDDQITQPRMIELYAGPSPDTDPNHQKAEPKPDHPYPRT